MIYCIWYPSGGFGHFINGVLTLHGNKFKRPTNKIKFSSTGDSHSLNLVAPKYTKNIKNYNYEFDSDYNYSVLIDLGINSNSREFMQALPEAQVIKLCYSDKTWPVVANTMVNKAMKSTVESEITVDATAWSSEANWAQREKYFLFLRDHYLRNAWRPESDIHNIIIDSLTNYNTLKDIIESIGLNLDNFQDLWNEWYLHNEKYFAPVTKAQQIIETIKSSDNLDLTDIRDVWTQAVIYYFIWLEFGKEVPHNDFENFFNDVGQIRTWLHP